MEMPDRLYVPCLLRDDEDGIVHEGGAFPTEREAQAVLDVWRSEGHREPMAINIIPVYKTAAEWQADR